MPISHLLLAVLVAIIWGVNFIFIKLSLAEISPLLLCALRFLLASIPAIFFMKLPAVPFRLIVLYGLLMFALQFAFLFLGMHVGMTPGMASLIMQVQIFFSMIFAVVFLGERPTIGQIVGALVAFSGIGLVAMHFDNNISMAGFICMLAGAAAWGLANLVTKKMKNVNMLAVVVWGSFVSFFPMLLLALIFEGFDSIISAYQHVTWVSSASLLYIVYISTWVGYGLWNWLLSRYPIGTIAPFSLLVPVAGLLTSVLFFEEPLQLWKLVAALLVLAGLCINVLSTRFFAIKIQRELVSDQ